MANNGANPFLFEETSTFDQQPASNPFLLEEDYLYGNSYQIENPFLSQTATTVIPTTNSTNPFAFDPMDLGPPEAETALSYDQNTKQTIETTITESPQKPTQLNLTHTNTTSVPTEPFGNNYSDDPEESLESKRVQPLRPTLPTTSTSKETQDLFMSVMGAMDATSSHLLDRIPPTRTPSPVSMKDLHSQCPTPEPSTYEDLLDIGDTKMQESETSIATQEQPDFHSQDLLSMIEENVPDVNQNPIISDEFVRNEVPTKPKPPRPEPPKKQVPPPKPPPPAVTKLPIFEENIAPPQNNDANEMIDMLGDSINIQPPPVQKSFVSTEDILNLYNKKSSTIAQPVEESKIDLLCDAMEMDTKPDLIQDHNLIEQPAIFDKPKEPELINSEITPQLELSSDISETNFVKTEVTKGETSISPEKSITDQHTEEVSDNQSRASLTSSTFNPFMTIEETVQPPPQAQQQPDIFTENNFVPPVATTTENNFVPPVNTTVERISTNVEVPTYSVPQKVEDEFDAFAAKFESVTKDENKNGGFDAFSERTSAWGNSNDFADTGFGGGFENDEPFDTFLSLQEPPQVPQSTPNKMSKAASQDSEEEKDFSVFIKPKVESNTFSSEVLPSIAPPPVSTQNAFSESSPRFNPFDQAKATTELIIQEPALVFDETKIQRTDSGETPPTPLFDEDVSQPLQPFPRTTLKREEWEMHLRQPNKKKITGQRFWKKIFVMLVHQTDCVLLQLYNQKGDKDPFQELPLQPCYSVSDIGAQQYDQYGKIFTLKLQYIFYKERPGVRPGQVKKAERITNKLSQFASYAIQGDYQGVKEFGSDLKKLGLPVEHAPQVSQLMKLGSLNYEDLKEFSVCIEEALFRLSAHRDRALHYKMEEVQVTTVDELYVEQESDGHIERQIARVRLFFLGFLTGMPDIELGVNDMRRQGKEVVGRHDIIPVVTEEWIRLEEVEFHSCVQQDEYQNSHIIKFKPPDACYIELMRFRVRPPKNRELPLQLKASLNITGNKVVLKADVLVPGFASRKLGQIPCEDVMIRYPIPECWIYLFRVEKHFRYGSVKSAHRRTGKIKGIERILGTVDNLQESLIEVTSGQAKYEHQHRALVWRCPRLPKEGQGAYTTHNMICRLALTSFDQMPEQLPDYCYIEFTMPATQVSHTTVRSVSLQNSDSDEPPEKYVRYLARHEYKVGIEHTEGESQAAYEVVTAAKPTPTIQEEPAPAAREDSDSDDSD